MAQALGMGHKEIADHSVWKIAKHSALKTSISQLVDGETPENFVA